MAGKGSLPRKVNLDSYDKNYDLIFKKDKTISTAKQQIEKQEQDFPELILESMKVKQSSNEN